MFCVEIDDIKSLTYRQVTKDGHHATEIAGADTDGCRFKITLRHDGRRVRLRELRPVEA